MEFDSQCQNSDEEVEFSVAENGDTYSEDFLYSDDTESLVLEAKIVYLLLPKSIPVSRSARLQWLLDHLNTVITFPVVQNLDNPPPTDIEIISVVSRDQPLTRCNRFCINSRTELIFLAQSYRFVYCLDMSPSQSVVDIQKNGIVFDEILTAFKASIRGLVAQFTIPGNNVAFQPNLYFTVMANTPFFMTPAQQVLVKGVKVMQNNVDEIIEFVQDQFHVLEEKIANVITMVYQQDEKNKFCNDLEQDRYSNKVPMVSPDVNFVNMLRYSILAVSLLPENSISHILVITDGVVAIPDSNITESLLSQLHYDSIAVSFLKVGSAFHPHLNAGYIAYTDLLHFFAHTTLGTYLETFPEVTVEPSMSMNVYQDFFLFWSFHSSRNEYFKSNSACNYDNGTFCSYKTPHLLSKRQTDENTSGSILILLARRIKEGFLVDNISYLNGIIEVQLSLQWKSFIYIHYKISSQWPAIKYNVHLQVHISAPYEFLHDITCMIKKESKSLYRQAVIERFWLRLSQISSTDTGFAQQLALFKNSSVWYTLPESLRNRIPVFSINTINADSNRLLLSPRNDSHSRTNLTLLLVIPNRSCSSSVSCSKFTNIWKPICEMETSSWRKWFHTHKFFLILKHDHPLPKHLHLANSSQRYQVVTCRQAATALYDMLAKWSSIVLIDNHTYLKLLSKEEKTPDWFCIVRITSKPPCAVLVIVFMTGTPGSVRHEVCVELKSELWSLSYMPSPGKHKENACCVILEKPLEKILIKYERMPTNFSTVIFPDGTQPPHSNSMSVQLPLSSSLFTTLSRYLYHKRWIWSASHSSSSRLTDNAVSRILNTLTKMRIKEGFSFAYSSSGIITMVLELTMGSIVNCGSQAVCVVQYVLFPPHRAWWSDNFFSDSEEDNDQDCEIDAELQMVTEVWIEPQFGKVRPSNPSISYMDHKYYYELADVISQKDFECINALLTIEHLSLMCQEKTRTYSMDTDITFTTTNRKNVSRRSVTDCHSPTGSQWYPIMNPRIEHIPFKFDPINILPLCQQTELLFSMFTERKDKKSCTNDYDKSNKILLDNIHDHLVLLHDQEQCLSKEESQRFTQQIIGRHNVHSANCPIDEYPSVTTKSNWRCFIKGISVTHVVLTFIPATLDDLKALVNHNIPTVHGSTESLGGSSKESNFSDVPINTTSSLTLPIYVYDCPLAVIVGAYIYSDDMNNNKDVYLDCRFKGSYFIQEDYIKLKSEDSNGFEDGQSEYGNCSKQHCKALALVHSKCFTISLFSALHQNIFVHSSDVQSAMDQCEETVSDIDITEYIFTLCGHIKHHKEDKIDMKVFNQETPCSELKSLHALIKRNFFKIINMSFNPVPSIAEYYFCKYFTVNKNESRVYKTNSDDEISNPLSDKEMSIFAENMTVPQVEIRREVGPVEVTPLFLHLICTIKSSSGDSLYTPVKVLPTCLHELIQNKEFFAKSIDKKKLHITLDILCLTLPNEVQNVISKYSAQGLRTTSFCSDGFQPSITSVSSDTSFNEEFPEPLCNLPEHQKNAIISLRDEIKWLLKDEIAAALLDYDNVTSNTLNLIMKHVTESKNRNSCHMDVINLNFVYESSQSYKKFVEEFVKIKIPHYMLHQQEDELYYLTKDEASKPHYIDKDDLNCTSSQEIRCSYDEIYDLRYLYDNDDVNSVVSDISSQNGSDGSDAGYDEDISDGSEDFNWLMQLENKRPYLPNFWLIMKIEQEAVTIYFHCRFLDLPSVYVSEYIEVQKSVRDEIRELCKKVNQSLLLQSLHETRNCNSLLEPDDNVKDWNITASPINSSYSRFKNLDDSNDDYEIMSSSVTLSEASLNFKSGYFSCPVVWEYPFVLHPRLKTGPGKSGISRGILALKNILDKFSVSNRNNMFVYRDTKHNVFYLRLHENVQNSSNTTTPMRSNEYENAIVSRSPSIISLPLGHNKSLVQMEHGGSVITANDIRPRVRSFGEKETKDGLCDDTLVLKVHGITEAGEDVRCDLVQVLQNRLDDAVLEFLSIMLARNAMCPLTPEDVHFIQKPFKPPEVIIRLTMQDFVTAWLDSFIHYLKQNLLQFLNVPKYIDNKSHFHFKDYSEKEQVLNRSQSDNIFIYNQSQNPSSGSRGIVCLALAVVYNNDNFKIADGREQKFEEVFENKNYADIISSSILDDSSELPDVHLEFRLWKQGRINIDNLSQKLQQAINQATWDIVMEHYLLKRPLCEKTPNNISLNPINVIDLSITEAEFNVNIIMTPSRDNIKELPKKKLEQLLPSRKRHRQINPPMTKTRRSLTFDDYEREKDLHQIKLPNIKPLTKLTSLEMGESGVLSQIYSKSLPDWLEFGATIGAPSVKKHKIMLSNSHSPNTTIKELLNFIKDTPRAFHAVPTNPLVNGSDELFIPFEFNTFIQKCVIISRNFDHWKASTAFNGTLDYPDFMSPLALKHSQKFVPSVWNKSFIPRQKILWILVQNDSFVIYSYNWSRDYIERLINDCTKLGQWLSVRSCFLNSVTSQKLGLFYNQAITQKPFLTSNNPYTYVIGVVGGMSEFPFEDSRKNLAGNSNNIPSILEAFRDSFHFSRYMTNDPVVEFANEMHEMKLMEKKSRDEMKKLHSMYQSRTSTVVVPQIFLLLQNSRIIHYCHTPLLFLQSWRLKAAATRNHFLARHQKANKNKNWIKNSWHTEMCYGFFCEYRRYLQTLGFMPLQIDNSDRKLGLWSRDNSSYNSIFYIQKTILGGILLYTVEFNEPFLATTLHAIECNRLQTITSRASINRFTLSFLDECDRVKISIHLHSFTYDYHLRCIYNYISKTPGVNKVCEKYDVMQFLDDFIKYYNKAPNFARNLIHVDTITIKDLITEGKQLYDYLIMNVGQYNFNLWDVEKPDGEIEYILVQISSSPQVSYKDSQDRQHTDDFDITLIVHNLCAPYNPTDNVLHLKYYLILTSKREMYPKSDTEQKLGKFRTVSSTTTTEMQTNFSTSDEANLDNSIENSTSSAGSTSSGIHVNSTVEISQESVNYLGYYSSHEQLMQQMILDRAKITQKHIKEMVSKGMVHCRTHLLWNKLVSPQDNFLTYEEFIELKGLAKLENLCDVHPNLGPLLNKPLSWYQGLAKLLLVKFGDQNRTFNSVDGNIQHYVILHPMYFGAFMLLSIDLHVERADVYAVYREPHKQEDAELCLAYRKALLDGFVNCICYYLWCGMI